MNDKSYPFGCKKWCEMNSISYDFRIIWNELVKDYFYDSFVKYNNIDTGFTFDSRYWYDYGSFYKYGTQLNFNLETEFYSNIDVYDTFYVRGSFVEKIKNIINKINSKNVSLNI